MTREHEQIGVELPERRRRDLDVAFEVGNRGLPDEGDRIEPAAGAGHLDPVVGVERRVIAERFDEEPGLQVPAPAQQRGPGEVELLVLDPPAVDQVLVLPGAVEQHIAGEPFEQRAGAAVAGDAVIDRRLRYAGAADEAVFGPEIVGDTREGIARPEGAASALRAHEPERRGGLGVPAAARDAAGALELQ